MAGTGTAPDNAPPPTPQPSQDATPPVHGDFDAAALAAAEAAVAKLDAAPKQDASAPAPETAPSGDAPPQEPPAAKPGPKPGERTNVQKNALRGILTALARTREENIELKARLEERQAIAAAPEGEPEPDGQPDPAAHVAHLQEELRNVTAQRVQVEQDYEDNKITGKERIEKLIALEQKRDEINSAVVLTNVALTVAQIAQQRQPETGDADAAGLVKQYKVEMGKRLEAQYPYMPQMSDGQLKWLADYARQEAAAQGRPYSEQPDLSEDIRIWSHIGQLTERFGPVMLPNFRPPPQGQPPAQGPSPGAAARNGKLDLQAQQPPDITALGRSAPGRTGATTEQFLNTPIHQLEQMSLKDLEKIQF